MRVDLVALRFLFTVYLTSTDINKLSKPKQQDGFIKENRLEFHHERFKAATNTDVQMKLTYYE